MKTTHTKGLFKWPDKIDVAWVVEDDITQKLGAPIMHNVRMGYMKFDGFEG